MFAPYHGAPDHADSVSARPARHRAHEGVTLDLLNELARDYMDDARNIIAVGSSGTGKSHVCDALGLAACEQGRRVRRYKAIEFVSELKEAQEAHQLHRYLRRLAGHDLGVGSQA